ncbi:growth/differentiation factor 15 [Dromaius novaehollandiae]|uniref:growth/differentiation factor 15 n=1 Tax=Dromaius novaehollandiae TaxID=8790 RepID=UPI00312001D8
MRRAPRDVRAAATCLPVLLLLSGVELRAPAAGDERLQLEAVKRGILERLGMAGPPAGRRPLDPDGVRRAQRLYAEKVAELMGNRSRAAAEEEEEEEEEGGVSGRSSVHRLAVTLQRQPDPPSSQQDPPGTSRYELLLTRTAAFQQRLRVLRAELSLFKQALGTPGSVPPPRVRVSRLPAPGAAPQPLREQPLPPGTALDLTAAVRPWAAGSEETLRLELAFPANAAALLAEEPVLAVRTRTRRRRGGRPRRARALEDECRKSDGKCCLRSLKVSFQDIGWADWVVAPSSYYMRFCAGSCPHNYKAASMHAQVKARLHALAGATPAPCCVPAAYDPMVLMHYDGDGRLVSTVFEDMLVTKCHCA